jgi:hypothetical protein
MTNATQQYIDNLAATAEGITNAAQAIQFLEYINNTIPDATDTAEQEVISTISKAACYWFTYGDYSDSVQPAIAVLSAIHAYQCNCLDGLIKLQERHAEIMQRELTDVEWTELCDYSYEQFCDDFAHTLNA